MLSQLNESTMIFNHKDRESCADCIVFYIPIVRYTRDVSNESPHMLLPKNTRYHNSKVNSSLRWRESLFSLPLSLCFMCLVKENKTKSHARISPHTLLLTICPYHKAWNWLMTWICFVGTYCIISYWHIIKERTYITIKRRSVIAFSISSLWHCMKMHFRWVKSK